jgi:membrane protein DedA with SNARE-associated domain
MNLSVLLSSLLSLKIAASPTGLLRFFQTHGYAILLLLMILEGPIVTYVAAFASSLGIFDIYYVLILSLLGNLLGDFIAFSVGRIGNKVVIEKYINHWLKAEKKDRIRNYLKNNPGKAIAVIKLTPPLPVPGLILAGTSDISLRTFLIYSLIVSGSYSLSMTLLGFYSGVAFGTISKYVKYIEFTVGGTVLLIVGIYFLIKYLSGEISSRIKKI